MRNSSKLILFGAVGLAALFLVIGGRGNQLPGAGNNSALPQQDNPSIPDDLSILEGDSPVLGDPNAPVTLVEFGDYQCTFCNKFFNESLSTLIEKYVDTGQLKIVFRDYAINGRESQNAAEAASCANEQGEFWSYHDKLFSERQGYNVGVFKEDNLVNFAGELGLNTDQFRECYKSGKYKGDIADDGKDARRFGVRGTPGFFLNGTLIPGAQPLAFWESAIQQLLLAQ